MTFSRTRITEMAGDTQRLEVSGLHGKKYNSMIDSPKPVMYDLLVCFGRSSVSSSVRPA